MKSILPIGAVTIAILTSLILLNQHRYLAAENRDLRELLVASQIAQMREQLDWLNGRSAWPQGAPRDLVMSSIASSLMLLDISDVCISEMRLQDTDVIEEAVAYISENFIGNDGEALPVSTERFECREGR